ncbi:hypothetical protein HU200_051073 [Digitaria exilis]|uniref:Terpene synthase N-terminal domain-containing protein n=1 Tax=Digitaria exilis TaxID=1010633 RepID=A0A835ALQ0_9POAL|nr:hypothetical protein HU200_051073 [Digitaria exilis]
MSATCDPSARLAPQSLHKLRHYNPSLWGDFFLNHVTYTPSQLLSMKERAQIKEDEVRRIILEIGASSNLAQKLELVDTLQRIEVFDKFRDEQRSISSDDVSCLLMLYDAAHMRIHGEETLDDMITFNKSRLQYMMMKNLEPHLAEEVRCTLETPRFRRVERVEARRYISVYEKKAVKWDEQTTDKFPAHMKALLVNILKTTNKILEELKLQENMHAELVKKLVICTAKFYHAEGDVSMVGRIANDIVSHKQYGLTAEQAKQKLTAMIEEAWMDIIEDYLNQKRPMELLEKAVDVARTMDFFYKYDDAYTLPLSLKDTLTSMYVNSV